MKLHEDYKVKVSDTFLLYAVLAIGFFFLMLMVAKS